MTPEELNKALAESARVIQDVRRRMVLRRRKMRQLWRRLGDGQWTKEEVALLQKRKRA